MTQSNPTFPFAYSGRNAGGQTLSGTIDAIDLDAARGMLESLRITLSDLSPIQTTPKARRLGGDDFLAFNQQLAQLAAAGLPVEQGLALISQEMRRGGLQRTIQLVQEDLQKGKSLAEAVEARRNSFPPLYAKLIDAGVRSGNLSGILLGLGQHMALFRRLQAAIWRAATYPLIVMACFVGLICFAIFRIVPQFKVFFSDFHAELPGITRMLIALSDVASSPPFLIALGMCLVAIAAFCLYLRFSNRGPSVAASIMLPMPLIGPVIQRNLIARWCDAVSLGVEAGMDLPSAIDLAAESIDSPALTSDGNALVAALSSGQPLTAAPPGQILPGTVPAAMEMASSRNDLPATLRTLSQMYRQRAELRLATVPAILTPFLLIMMGALTAVLAFAMLAPIITLIQDISGPHK